MLKLLVVGGGKMGEALLGGLLAAEWAKPDEVGVLEKLAARRAELRASYPGVAIVDQVEACEAAILAVKPNDMRLACEGFPAGAGRPGRVLSIAAGITLAAIEAGFAGGALPAVVRAMPNTPALVGAGVAAIAGGSTATDADLVWAEEILGSVGTVVRVTEPQLDAVTGLSGSGPAYVFLIAEALIEAGVLVGLARPIAEKLAIGTIAGAAALMTNSDRSPADLRGDVTSPGGTTAAGLRALEDRAVRAAFLDAVSAATRRSAELGQA